MAELERHAEKQPDSQEPWDLAVRLWGMAQEAPVQEQAGAGSGAEHASPSPPVADDWRETTDVTGEKVFYSGSRRQSLSQRETSGAVWVRAKENQKPPIEAGELSGTGEFTEGEQSGPESGVTKVI